MASFVYAVWSITNVASVHCAARPEISPCTCEPIHSFNYMELSCEKVDSFHRIFDALSNKFQPSMNVSLKISHSQLDDLEMCSFSDMQMNLVKLRMQWNGLKSVPEKPFRGLSNVEFLSVGDNELDEIPKHMLNHMPYVKTLDIGRCRIRSVLQDDFKGIQLVTNLFLPGNNITRLDKGAFPPGLVTLHLGRNQIEYLNGTLRDLNKLESLFINMNSINSLDDELPESNRLKLIIAQNNRLERLPESMRYMNKLETLHLQYNRLRSLDNIFTNAKNLTQFFAFNNEIEYLGQNEFQSSDLLEELDLAFNRIRALNQSLLPLQRLHVANFSFNEIDEFSMNEIRGLMYLKQLDLSNNRIQKLTGRQDNNIDQNSFLIEFNLAHNQLKSLDGALMGLNSLRILSLSYNQIERILPEDFIGLVKLEILELSHNQLLTLKEMETTFLPNLKILKAAYNNLTKLEKDFHGLPVLCQANLTNNQISSISTELVSETRCMNHNVPGKLELHLDDNPIMCEERLNELCPIMLAQETRIRGRSPCFDNDQEVCVVLPMLFTPVIITDKLPIILQQQLNSKSSPNTQMMQVVVPSTIIVNKNKKPDELLPPLIAPLGQPISNPLIIAPTITPPTTTTTTASTTTTTATATIPMPTLNALPPTTTTAASVETAQPMADTSIQLTQDQMDEVAAIPDDTIIRTLHMAALASDINDQAKKSDETEGNQSNAAAVTSTNTTQTENDESNAGETGMEKSAAATTTTTTTATTTTTSTIRLPDMNAPDTPPLVLDIEEPTVIGGPPVVIPADGIAATGTMPHQSSLPMAAGAAAAAAAATQTEYATVEYIPNLDEFAPLTHTASSIAPPPASVALDEDSNSNSVHEEEFPTAFLTDLDNPQSLLIPEEPPENP